MDHRPAEYSQQRFIATLFWIFAGLALTLAAVGLYSVVCTDATRTTSRHSHGPGRKIGRCLSMVLCLHSDECRAGLAVGIAVSFAFDKLATQWVFESPATPSF